MRLEDVITEVQVLRLQPGDVLVLKSQALMTPEGPVDLQRASVAISKFVGFRVQVVVVPPDAGVAVLRSGDGTTLLPHQNPLNPDPLKPLPMPPPGTNAYHVIKGPRVCSVCKETQFPTPNGWTCRQGHGETKVEAPPPEVVVDERFLTNPPLGKMCTRCGARPCECPSFEEGE